MSFDRKEELLLWIDVETTALDPDDGDLLEVGMMLTDMRGRAEADRHWLLRPHCGINLNPDTLRAVEMHWGNGLLKEVYTAEARAAHVVADDIREAVDEWTGDATVHPAGSNVDFDLRWLCAKLGLHITFAKLSHRKLDLTSLRLMDVANGLDPYQSHATTHRVEDCLNRDLKEYRQRIEQMFDNRPDGTDTITDTITDATTDTITETLRRSPTGGCE